MHAVCCNVTCFTQLCAHVIYNNQAVSILLISVWCAIHSPGCHLKFIAYIIVSYLGDNVRYWVGGCGSSRLPARLTAACEAPTMGGYSRPRRAPRYPASYAPSSPGRRWRQQRHVARSLPVAIIDNFYDMTERESRLSTSSLITSRRCLPVDRWVRKVTALFETSAAPSIISPRTI